MKIILVLMFTTYVLGQRRELEADLIGIANAHQEVVADNPDEALKVSLSLMLRYINKIDVEEQELESNGWLSMSWKDSRFHWDPKKHGNLTKVSLPCRQFPKPDIKLYNSIEEGLVVDSDVNCVVESDGKIRYIPPVQISSFCQINDPTTDTFECDLKFGSWTHPCHDFQLVDVPNLLDIQHFEGGWRFEILEHSGKIVNKKYDCCPETYCSTQLHLKIRDHSKTPGTKFYYQFHHY